MAPASETIELINEPPWPEVQPGNEVAFLLDASSGVEQALLEDWIKRHCPNDPDVKLARIFNIPATRRPSRDGIEPGLEALLAADQDHLLAPLRVVWLPKERDGSRAVRLSDLLKFGDPRDPGKLRQRYVLKYHPDRCRIVAGAPAPISDLRHRWAEAGGRDGGSTTGLSDFVARQAALALERAERRVRGARYKVPRLIHQEVLASPSFRGRLARVARDAGVSEAEAMHEAEANLREIAATHSPFMIDIVAHLIHLLYKQGYAEQLQYDREQLAGIAGLSQRHPVVFLPTHKSNLDHLVLQYALHENGLPPNHTAAGINMNFFPLGSLVRRSGAFFIRRSFKDVPIYRLVLGAYIDYLIGKRFSLEWYIEGGRSRSGKLLPPRFGLLANVLDAYRRGKSEDVFLIPVSIAYDQIQEVGTYSEEQRGKKKEKEGLGWLIRTIRGMRRRYGKIHIRFGEPVSLREQLGAPEQNHETGPDENEIALQKLAFEVCVRINRVTSITPTSLLTLALLGTGARALTVDEARRGLGNLLRYVEMRKLPATAQCFDLASNEGVKVALEALVENGVVTRFEGGPEVVYRIRQEQQLAASYYRNTIIHFFVNAGIAEIAVLHVNEGNYEDPIAEFWDAVMRLRDLFKFEFFFADKETFRAEMREELAFHDADWEARLEQGEAGALIQSFRPFTAHRVLRPFLECYRVVSDGLLRCNPGQRIDRDRFLDDCLGLGKQYQLQQLIQSSASVSKALFTTALSLAEHRRLLADDAGDIDEQRRAFADEVRDAHRRVDMVEALAASRRAGLID